MLFQWIVVALVANALVIPALAEEKDAPLLFDDPAFALEIPHKKRKIVRRHEQITAKPGKKVAVKKSVKPHKVK